MNVYNLRLTVCFKRDIKYIETNEVLGNFISLAMFNDNQLKLLHEKNTFKFYHYSLPFPVEQNGIYQKNKLYIFDIRSFKEDIIVKFKHLLPKVSTDIKVITSEVKIIKQRQINKLISLTPAVAILGNKCWTKEDGLELIMNRIHSNAVKKARVLLGENFSEPKENFIECIQQLNFKPIKMKYKNTSILSNKFELVVRADDASQQLAWTVFGMGLLEKGSQGYGYCIAK